MNRPKHLNVVYKLTCLSTNKSYYGLTTRGLDVRWKGHIGESSNKWSQHLPLYKDLKEYDLSNWTHEIVFVGFDRYVINRVEMLLIERNNSIITGYNIKEGGIGFDLYHNKYTDLMT